MLSIVFALLVVWKGAARTINPRRLLIDLEIAFAGAAVWILVSAAEWTWVTPIVLTVMTVVLLDAARIAARPADDSAPPWLTDLTRVLVGVYAAWATAAVFRNWAAAIGADLADPQSLGWQVAILLACAVVGLAVTTAVGSVLVAYPLTLVWAFVGIIVAAQGRRRPSSASRSGRSWRWSSPLRRSRSCGVGGLSRRRLRPGRKTSHDRAIVARGIPE